MWSYKFRNGSRRVRNVLPGGCSGITDVDARTTNTRNGVKCMQGKRKRPEVRGVKWPCQICATHAHTHIEFCEGVTTRVWRPQEGRVLATVVNIYIWHAKTHSLTFELCWCYATKKKKNTQIQQLVPTTCTKVKHDFYYYNYKSCVAFTHTVVYTFIQARIRNVSRSEVLLCIFCLLL